jgi:hypothetical protein
LAGLLASLILVPVAVLAQEEIEVKPEVKTGADCKYPVDLLWHAELEDDDDRHKMAVSVRNPNGQQVPGLTVDNFDVVHKGALVAKGDGFSVAQSKSAFSSAVAEEEEEPEKGAAPRPTSVDPIAYDVYFNIDLTASMGDELKKYTKLMWVGKILAALVRPDKAGRYRLFDAQDRVYISGFTSKLQTGFMDSPTINRDKINQAVLDLQDFTPKDKRARLYGGILYSLDRIKDYAEEYSDPAKRRQAVLITLTDSFNGIDPNRGRKLRDCAQNDALNDQVRRAILETRKATNQNLKVYILGLGVTGDTDKYFVNDEPARRCRIAETEAQVLDARSLSLIGNRQLGGGGFFPNENPGLLMKWIVGEFEALKTAYEITYNVPDDSPEPGIYKVTVLVGNDACSHEVEERNSFVALATKKLDTSPGEMALFLASLMIALFFIPRSLSNLGNLRGGSSPAPKKKKKGKGKKKKRK